LIKKKIWVGSSEEKITIIVDHIEKNNIPYEIAIKDIFKQSAEMYEAFYMLKVRKKYAEQVEVIVAQYVSLEQLKQEYKVKKDKSRKLEKKEKVLHFFIYVMYLFAIMAIEIGKNIGANIVPYICASVLLLCGLLLTIRYYKEMQKAKDELRQTKQSLMFISFGMFFYAVTSIVSLLRS